MMTFAKQLQKELSTYSVLKHPYYQAWNEGRLSQESLQTYSKQYFKQVDAFPRYISATHSLCDNIETRQLLLENLNDEEGGSGEHHPELWMRFAEGLGVKRDAVESQEAFEETKALVDTFYRLSRSSFEEGLGALYAYEQQVPEVSKTKIEGLIKFYGIEDERTLSFFEVHRTADVYHSVAVAKILDSLPEEAQQRARSAALEAAKALWTFLSGVCAHCKEDFADTTLPQAA